MTPIFIGISGGTGAGKSTLCTALMDAYPEQVGMIQLDDYFRPKDQVPTMEGHINWDHPDALFLNKLAQDLEELGQGRPATIRTKNERLNPDYKTTNERISVVFEPKQIMLVEGYLVLHDPRVRRQLTTAIWLEVPHETRWKRRVHFKNSEYEEKVLHPMYEQFAEPTKQYAEHVIDVGDLSRVEVFQRVSNIVEGYLQKLP